MLIIVFMIKVDHFTKQWKLTDDFSFTNLGKISWLTHFWPILPFCTPWKYQKTLVLRRHIKWQRWPEMGYKLFLKLSQCCLIEPEMLLQCSLLYVDIILPRQVMFCIFASVSKSRSFHILFMWSDFHYHFHYKYT